ncbi:hypothetical protein evm_001846 [Chilo suppressalis]|nr:hypothetical protein evm_001846 [Chilo suppressalis]
MFGWRVVLLLSLLALVVARPQEFDDEEDGPGSAPDKRDDIARVQIKVYRGPTKNDGYAPWGFWVKQPSDDE